MPYPLDPPTLVSVIVRGPRGPDAIAPALRQAVRELDPDLPLYLLMTLEGAVAKADWNSRFSNLLITTITIIAVVLAAVGLYAVTAHAIALRIQELGVRIALGAGPAHLLWLLLRRAVVQLCAGLGIGVAAVFVWSRFLPGSIGSVRLTDVEGLAMAGAVMAMLGLIGSFVPAVRAVRLNPIVALRYE